MREDLEWRDYAKEVGWTEQIKPGDSFKHTRLINGQPAGWATDHTLSFIRGNEKIYIAYHYPHPTPLVYKMPTSYWQRLLYAEGRVVGRRDFDTLKEALDAVIDWEQEE